MATVKTRSETEHGILGQPRPFQTNQLPTSADVFKAYDYLLKNNNCASVTERATVIANEIKALYNKASIPTIAVSSLVIRIKRLINKVHELGKYSDRKKSSATFKSSLQMLDQLFDICLCKCFNKGVRERSACSCPLPKKIPTLEWEFWIDQKTVRKMVIGKVDKEETIKLQKREKRGSKTCNLPITDKKMKFDKEIDPNETYCSDNEQSKPDEEFLPIEMSDGKVMSSYEVMSSDNEMSSDEEMKVYNTKQYPELCKAMDRCKISNRDACLIANAVLKDLDLITPENAIDPAKLRRQRNMWRKKEVKKHAAEVQKILCIGFDGKQDITSVKTSGVQRNFKEEHYVIVSFPQNKYVNHVTPQSSKAVDIAQEILLSINNIKSSDTLAAVVCDGSVNNTGQHNGVIRKLEEGLGRTLQWLVCLLHANELPFRKYFSVVDGGRSTGPATSTGKIDIALDFDPKDLDIVNFKHIPGKVEDVSVDVKKDLSSDQIYLLKACLAVQQGYTACDQILFLQTAMPGNLNHARWLTKANRILRLYMSKENPSKPLQRITRFIVNVYAPSWFNIKRHSSCLDGARNFFYLMKQCYELGKEEWKILEPVLQNNCYFAHPENILIGGVTDVNCILIGGVTIRQFLCDKIIDARATSQSSKIRVFDKSSIKLDPEASSFIKMIDWSVAIATPPPLLSTVSNDDLEHFQFHVDVLSGIPCHSQAVERTIKDISATTMKVFGHKSRHGMILQCRKSRAELPKIDSKSDFLSHNK